MTETELVKALSRMRNHGRSRDELTPMTNLFGIIFCLEIEDLGPGGPDRIAKAYNEKGYVGKMNGTVIRDGMNLAPYVEPHPGVRRRWRR